jgi:hypothetical protein
MGETIFYSWQSDLPNSTNRGLINRALEDAAQTVGKSLELDLALDRDTKGTAGTPDIAHAIFSKITNASIFVGDVSIIN